MATPKSPRNNQNRDEIVELAGCKSWKQVVKWFGGKSVSEIQAEANRCWPHEDNTDFANRVYNELN